jgi:hypothetical protein
MLVFRRTAILAALAAAAIAGQLVAQGHEEHGGAGAPPEQLGKVVFPMSCNAEAQHRFERAVALQHSFWYEEAGKAFKDVVASDSTCGLGYWGYAMSLLHPLWAPPTPADLAAGAPAAEQAVRLTAPGSRERGYAEAIATFYRDAGTRDHRHRLLAYEEAMGRLVEAHPEDEEARTFYALALIAVGNLTPEDTSLSRQAKAGALLEPLYQKHPDHPGLAHYLIHAYDFPRFATRAAGAAQHYAGIAPSVPHAQHMPSHIYTRLGMWDEDIASNLSSREAARQYEQTQHLNALWDQDGHAMDYLVYAYLQQGRDRDARQLVSEAAKVTASFPLNSLTNDYALAAIPARYALERGKWDEAAKLVVRPAPAWPAAEGITHFARAIGAVRTGNAGAAEEELRVLGALEDSLVKLGGAQVYWSTQAKIQRLAVSAWIARVKKDTTQALLLIAQAADLEDVTEKHPVTPGAVVPARELQGDLLLDLGKPAEARKAYEATLARSPHRARSLFGAARAAELSGDRTAAGAKYQEYLEVTVKGDGARAEAASAKAFR